MYHFMQNYSYPTQEEAILALKKGLVSDINKPEQQSVPRLRLKKQKYFKASKILFRINSQFYSTEKTQRGAFWKGALF